MPPSYSQDRPGGDRSTGRVWQQQHSTRSQQQQQQQEQQQQQQQRQQQDEGQSPTPPAHGEQVLTRSESWIELASQPSSSSLSSIGDEIVTTGLRIGNGAYAQRRRRLQQMRNPMPSTYIVSHAAAQADASSQEEYDETESEEDRLMSSSTEQVTPLPRQETATAPAVFDSEDDDDENATALGVRRPSTSPTFRPQPNAFSHPPSNIHRHSSSSAVPQHPHTPRPALSQRSHTRAARGSSLMSPSHQADNDAALRASLTTLLSCAHAAGLRKKEAEFASTGVQRSPTQPMELRLVPESELMEDARPGPSTTATKPPPLQPQTRVPPHLRSVRTASNSSAPSVPESSTSRSRDHSAQPEKTTTMTTAATTTTSKRSSEPKSQRERAAKKKRTASPTGRVSDGTSTSTSATLISPTVLTWVVSAGVLVLVVGFGAAGFVIGREVGRQEGAAGLATGCYGGSLSAAGNASSCGQEVKDVIRSGSGGTLRRFKWGGVGRSVVA